MGLINVAEAKKSSNAEIISSVDKLSRILNERYLNDPNFDPEQVFKALLADDCFSSPDKIRVPFIINPSVIAVPSIPARKNSDGSYANGPSVTSLVHIPGSEPYYSFDGDSETFIDQRMVTLRGVRSITLHRIIPGMVVSFHHYTCMDGNRGRNKIDAVKIVYDKQGEAVYEQVPEEEALVNMPALKGR